MQPRTVINRLIQPELALAFGTKDISLFRSLFTKSCQFSLWGCFVACLSVGLGAHWIFSVWTGGKVAMDWPAYLVLLVGVLMNSIWYTALIVPYATNRHGPIAVFYTLVYGAIAFVLGYLGAARMGLAGAALSLFFVEMAMAFIVIREALQMTNMSIAQWSQTVLRPPYDLFGNVSEAFKRLVKPTSETIIK
jgi:O-antigen/teichoic acid export membrane protein